MKILYVHGYGSRVNPKSEKYKVLGFLGKVNGVAPNYDLGYYSVIKELKEAFQTFKPDLIVGTSMGAWSASIMGEMYSIPTIALNPVLNPENVTQGCLKGMGYKEFVFDSRVKVFLNAQDEVIDSFNTERILKAKGITPVILDGAKGGSHRFENIKEIISVIEDFSLLDSFCFGDNGIHP